jgi:hypothetical protein
MVKGHKDKDGNFHPHDNKRNGVSEKDMNISQKGNNDTIVVEPTRGMKGNQESNIKSRRGEEYDHGIFLAIRSMVARYGGMTLHEFMGIYGDDDEKEVRNAFEELVTKGYLKDFAYGNGKNPSYNSIKDRESIRVRKIAEAKHTPYFDELENF